MIFAQADGFAFSREHCSGIPNVCAVELVSYDKADIGGGSTFVSSFDILFEEHLVRLKTGLFEGFFYDLTDVFVRTGFCRFEIFYEFSSKKNM